MWVCKRRMLVLVVPPRGGRVCPESQASPWASIGAIGVGVCGPSEGGVGGGAAAPPSAPGEGGGLASAPSRGSTPRDGLPPLGPLWLGSEVTHFLLPNILLFRYYYRYSRSQL